MTRSLAVLLGALALTSCASFAKRTTASVEEYTRYRRFRTAAIVEEKLAAGYDYLERHPAGRWKGEVREWFNHAEAWYLEHAWDEVPALQAYVEAVPRGRGAEAALARIRRLEELEEHRARGERALDEKARRLSERLEAAELARRELVAGIAAWVRRLGAFRQWGARTHEIEHELIHAFSLSKPEARCTEAACTKTILVSYAIPEAGRQSERQAVYDVRLDLEDGGIRSWTLSGPELWSRMGEAIDVRPIATLDYGARAEALAKAVEVVSVAIEPMLPAKRCEMPAVSPILIHRRCDSVEFRMVAAIESGEEDRVELVPYVEPSP